MSSETKTLALAGMYGGISGCFLTGFMDAVRAGNNLVAVLCSILYLVMFMLMWRVIRHYRKLKGWQ